MDDNVDVRQFNGFGEMTNYLARYDVDDLLENSYEYDALGRITNRREIVLGETKEFDYTYDLAGRLVEVRTNGAVRSIYQYDANGNRTNSVVAARCKGSVLGIDYSLGGA